MEVSIIENIVLYSTDCPKCKVLKKKLEDNRFDFSENHSVEEMIALGFNEAPILKVGEQFMKFPEAILWLNERR